MKAFTILLLAASAIAAPILERQPISASTGAAVIRIERRLVERVALPQDDESDDSGSSDVTTDDSSSFPSFDVSTFGDFATDLAADLSQDGFSFDAGVSVGSDDSGDSSDNGDDGSSSSGDETDVSTSDSDDSSSTDAGDDASSSGDDGSSGSDDSGSDDSDS